MSFSAKKNPIIYICHYSMSHTHKDILWSRTIMSSFLSKSLNKVLTSRTAFWVLALISRKIFKSFPSCALNTHTHTHAHTGWRTWGILKDKETFRLCVCVIWCVRVCQLVGTAIREKGSIKWVRCYIYLVTSAEENPTKLSSSHCPLCSTFLSLCPNPGRPFLYPVWRRWHICRGTLAWRC